MTTPADPSSQNPSRTGASRLTGDVLGSWLPTHADADRPWLVWYAPGERIELTGHVLAMWAAKIAGFLEAEARPAAQVHLSLPAGWRAVAWALGTWLGGGALLWPAPPHRSWPTPELTSSGSASAGGGLAGAGDRGACTGVCAASRVADLDDEAEIQVLVPAASLAVRWEGEGGEALPPLVLDGAADVMTYADHYSPALPLRGDEPAWVEPGRVLSRNEVARAAQRLAQAVIGSGARAALVHCTDAASAITGALGAWAAGRTAVLLSPEASEDVAATAARQEGVY